MRRKLHVYTGQQWDFCQRCGQLYPMGELTLQKGLLVCTAHCHDNLDVEHRQRLIDDILGTQDSQEGADQRQEHWNYFAGWTEAEG